MIDPVMGRFKVTEYNDICAIPIANLVETKWLNLYPCTTERRHDQGS